LIGSYSFSNGAQTQETSLTFFLFYNTDGFHVAVRLFSNWLQKTLKSVTHTAIAPCASRAMYYFCSYHILKSSAINY